MTFDWKCSAVPKERPAHSWHSSLHHLSFCTFSSPPPPPPPFLTSAVEKPAERTAWFPMTVRRRRSSNKQLTEDQRWNKNLAEAIILVSTGALWPPGGWNCRLLSNVVCMKAENCRQTLLTRFDLMKQNKSETPHVFPPTFSNGCIQQFAFQKLCLHHNVCQTLQQERGDAVLLIVESKHSSAEQSKSVLMPQIWRCELQLPTCLKDPQESFQLQRSEGK